MDTTHTANDNPAAIAVLFAILDAPALRVIDGGLALTPANDVAAPALAVIKYDEIRTKRTGDIEKGYQAEVIPGASVRIFGVDHNGFKPRSFDLTFKVGDVAVYDSFNFAFTGSITKIGPKTVTIKGTTATRQLDLCSFMQKNWNYCAERITKERLNWMD